ncbi:hypothetical protein Psed_1913 [Pseudonocardia dioxanivorans CB1190]|uniref:Uncharacterized protein n=1 Tax=Pseudonocardia dioxanivorans (strain ATCC 55486 / DSM 44775 / JCM 13855 / CB1190) TaxID=675635 RepID=F4CU68_PSEUX|nr:hypothetical protein [Pseudonocardia dioxanivorans]AEA24146.1 hypothetical protein Psed_1913 [Pseudonocardia dioxanivorans CB1190]
MAGPDAADPVADLVEAQLADAGATWTIGVTGAVAEFSRRPGEPAARGPRCVVTGRGGVRLELPDTTEVIAYEVPSGPDNRWNHAVAFCLDAGAARMAARTVVTALGPDEEAIRPRDRVAVRYDLGLGIPTVDACVRTADPALREALDGAAGEPMSDELVATLVRLGPHRVFAGRCGRVEVFAPIARPGTPTPDGPHTHLHADRLRPTHTHPDAAPIGPDLVSCVTLHPAHPVTDANGHAVDFDETRHAAFQKVLDTFGDPVAGAHKAMTIAAVRAGVGPDLTMLPRDPASRAAVAVTLRQLLHTDGPSPTLDVWRTRHPPDAGLLHPDG